MRVRQTYTLALFIRGDEFDAGLGKGASDSVQGANAGIYLTAFQSDQGIERNYRIVRQLLLRPAQQRPCGSNLARRDHAPQSEVGSMSPLIGINNAV